MEKLFSEIYNRYFGIVNLLLEKEGVISPGLMRDTVRKHGFGESVLFLLPALAKNRWGLFEEVNGGCRSRIPGGVKIPLSTLQKRWIRAVLEDPRAGLFLTDDRIQKLRECLADVQPLFHYEDFYYFDRFSDADDYADAGYREHFRIILQAIRSNDPLVVRYNAGPGRFSTLTVRPQRLEYSVKNDCFRLHCTLKSGKRIRKHTLRVSRIMNVRYCGAPEESDGMEPEAAAQESVTVLIRDERNAMERAMLQFADYRKNTQRLDAYSYRCEIFYDKEDETELLIEILSFGPMMEVMDIAGNEAFLASVRERLRRQRQTGLSGEADGQKRQDGMHGMQ